MILQVKRGYRLKFYKKTISVLSRVTLRWRALAPITTNGHIRPANLWRYEQGQTRTDRWIKSCLRLGIVKIKQQQKELQNDLHQ